jgi:hypothetical protein
MKFLNFFSPFLWVIFALLDPDPEFGPGSTNLIDSGSEILVLYRIFIPTSPILGSEARPLGIQKLKHFAENGKFSHACALNHML